MNIAAAFQFKELYQFYNILSILLGIYTFLLIFGEWFYQKIFQKKVTKKEQIVSITSGVVGVLTQGFFSKLITASLMWWVYSHRLFSPSISWKLWVLCIVLSTSIQYFNHYLYHKVRVLWCFHIVHHSAEEMNFSTAIRTSVLDIFTIESFYLLLPLLGVPPVMYFIVYVFYKIWGMFIHIGDEALAYKDIPVLKHIIVTPLFHKIHHAKNEPYLDKNFSEISPIFDKIFGTYAPYTEIPEYGIIKDQPQQRFWEVQTHAFLALKKDIQSTSSIITKLKYIFYPPGWAPKAL